MATNILADRLEMLERIGIVEKTKNTENKTKFIYSLTPKGIDLLPIIIEFIVWSAKHDLGTDVSEEFIAQAKKNRKRLIVKIGTVLKQKRVYPI